MPDADADREGIGRAEVEGRDQDAEQENPTVSQQPVAPDHPLPDDHRQCPGQLKDEVRPLPHHAGRLRTSSASTISPLSSGWSRKNRYSSSGTQPSTIPHTSVGS